MPLGRFWVPFWRPSDFEGIEVLPVGATTASQVSFTQAGSTSGRNVQLKLQESISVLDFGADPTGATDSTVAINAAVGALPAGGTLLFPVALYSNQQKYIVLCFKLSSN